MAVINIEEQEVERELETICEKLGRKFPKKEEEIHQVISQFFLEGINFGIKKVESFIKKATTI